VPLPKLASAAPFAFRCTFAGLSGAVSGLARRYPGDGIVGEENDTGDAITFDVGDPNGRVWVIDPIDGTNNFIAGLGAFGVCIGLLEKGSPVLGVVFDVTRDVMYSGGQGRGGMAGEQAAAGIGYAAQR